MTNEHDIAEIMKSARDRITSENAVPVTVARMPAEEVAALLDEIERLTHECADLREDYANLKDAMRDDGDAYRAEIAELKQRLADSMRDLQVLKADPVPGEWVEWKGGECPIADGVRHQVMTRDGMVSPSVGFQWRDSWWSWTDPIKDNHIIAYRIIP